MSNEPTQHWLPFYLRDHMAGAQAGVNLLDRVATGHSSEQVRVQVARLRDDFIQDRRALRAIMMGLGVRRVSMTMITSVVGEKVGRLKPNGALAKRSPGADVLELEALAVAAAGKARLWETLLMLADDYPRLDADQLRRLKDRADAQSDAVVDLHAQVVCVLPVM